MTRARVGCSAALCAPAANTTTSAAGIRVHRWPEKCTPAPRQAASRAASSARLSTERSPGTDSARHTCGPRDGSARRACRPDSSSTCRPIRDSCSASRSRSARSPGSTATTNVPRVRRPGSAPAATSSPANAGQRRSEAVPSASISASPGAASVTGASIPPATREAPDPGAGSCTVTANPADAARNHSGDDSRR